MIVIDGNPSKMKLLTGQGGGTEVTSGVWK